MYYSLIGFLASLILILINRDIITFNKKRTQNIPALIDYRAMLFCILVYYFTDFMWGIFDFFKWKYVLYADTFLYYVMMCMTILFWTRFVSSYLKVKDKTKKILLFSGNIFFLFEIVALIINFFYPIVFAVDYNGTWFYVGPIRYIALGIQIILFVLTSVQSFISYKKVDNIYKIRCLTTGIFGVIMGLSIFIQLFFPELPIYTIGYMISTLLIYSFVIEEEKEEFKRKLEDALEKEQQNRLLAHTDPLTGVKNKLAFIETESDLEQKIENKEITELGIAMFDLNGLKIINDTKGHEAGDKYIQAASKLICNTFKHSPVYRVGGDEFVALLQNQDYNELNELKNNFANTIIDNLRKGGVIISIGVATLGDNDESFQSLFERADKEMYQNKDELKRMNI